MKIEITKLTDVELLRKVNAITTKKESNQTLKDAYKHRHTTIRTQLFMVECYDIPQSAAYHLRTHFTLYPMPPFEYAWMLSKRPDRGADDFTAISELLARELEVQAHNIEDQDDNGLVCSREDLTSPLSLVVNVAEQIKKLPKQFGRQAPTDFSFMISAEGLMKMAETRLCKGVVASYTRKVVEGIVKKIKDVDPDLYPHLVRPCVSTGICREKCCGFIHTAEYDKERWAYAKLFDNTGAVHQ